MTSKERVLAVLNGQQPDKVPFIDWWHNGIREKITKALGGDPHMDEAQFAGLVGMDAICIEKYCAPFFCEVIKDDQGGDHFQGEGLIKKETDFKKMRMPDPKDESYYDDAKRYIDKYGASGLALYPVFRTGMLNVIYSIGLVDFSYALFQRRSFVEKVFEIFTDWTCEVLTRLQPLGFDFLMSFDDIAYNTGPFFSPRIFDELFAPGLKQITDVINLPWAYHSDGNLIKMMDRLVALGMNAINPFQPDVMNIKDMKDQYGDHIAVWGNIDLGYTLTRGTVEETIAEVTQRLKECGPGGGFIIGSSNTITDYCKLENVLAMVETINKYRKYPITIN